MCAHVSGTCSVLQLSQQCVGRPGGLGDEDHNKVDPHTDIDSNPKEERDKVEQQGYSPVQPSALFLTTGVGFVGL